MFFIISAGLYHSSHIERAKSSFSFCCFSYFYWIQTNTFLLLSPVLGRYLLPHVHKLVEFAVQVLSKWTDMIDFDCVFCTKKEVEVKIGLTMLGPQSFKHICCPLLKLSSAALSTL